MHFDETGFRTAGRLAWVYSALPGKFVLVTVHAKRGKDGMKAARVLPLFRGIAVHDAWKPYDSYDNVAGHALSNSHLLRELIAVTETGTALDQAWAQQAINALLALKDAAGAAREAGHDAIGPQAPAGHEDWFPKAAASGIALNAARKGKLQPGESRSVTVTADPRLVARFDADAGQWHITGGSYRIALGRSADDLILTAEAPLAERLFGR